MSFSFAQAASGFWKMLSLAMPKAVIRLKKKLNEACPEVVELHQPTAKELWKLLVFIRVVLGQAAITLGVCT